MGTEMEQGKKGLDVFISYSTKNKNVADAVVANFEQNGIKCWYAPRDITPGQEWVSAIKDALKSAKIFVLIYTAESNLSRQVMNEVALAFNAGMTIVPFRLTEDMMNDELEYYLTRVHWLDAVSKPLESSIEALRNYVEVILHGTQMRASSVAQGTSSGAVNAAAVAGANKNATAVTSSAPRRAEDAGKKKSKLGLWIGLAVAAVALIVGGVFAGIKMSGPKKGELMAAGYEALYYGLEGTEDLAIARENYEKAAEKGVADAYYYLGQICEREYDYQSAREYYEKGIDAGSNLARLGMGHLWQRGLRGEANMNKAWELYNEALDNGCVEADYYRAQIVAGGFAGQTADAAKAVKLLKNVIEESDNLVFVADAYNELGKIYRKGRMGVPKDLDAALAIYKKVAETIDSKKFKQIRDYNSGLAYNAMGEEIKADDSFRMAFELFKDMADAGSISAKYWVGNCYRFGNGTEKNYEEALKWYLAANDAAKEQNPKTRCHEALYAIGQMYAFTNDFERNYDKAYEYYKEASDYGYGLAANAIGDLYYYGHRGVDEEGQYNYNLARQWYDKALEHGCSEAYFSIGYIYSEGKGATADEAKALEYYKKGAELGSSTCAYNVGAICYRLGKEEEAFQWYQKAADLECVDAYYILGVLYLAGGVTEKNENLGIEYLTKAANENHTGAIEVLTEDYYYGAYSTGVAYEEAFRWAQKGAELEDSYCMYILGCLYLDGRGTDKNAAEAANWLLKAAMAEDYDAMYKYGKLILYGDDGVQANENEAVKWLQKAGENGVEDGYMLLADYYINQNKVDKSFVWLCKAYDEGYELKGVSLYNIAYCYYQGLGTKADEKKAFQFMKMAAEKGDFAKAMIVLGSFYYDGTGTSVSYKNAAKWFGAAIDTGELNADDKSYCLYELQVMYESGKVSKQDVSKWVK